MKKIVSILAIAAISVPMAVMANDELKANMHQLDSYMIDMQAGFLNSDKKKVLASIEGLQKQTHALFGKESAIKAMLPKEKQFKSRIAITSAAMIQQGIDTIRDNMDNARRDTAQNAYLDIERACMRCHNLVRDW